MWDKQATMSELSAGAEPPWELLLLADPCMDMVKDYITRGRVFVARLAGTIIGVYVLVATRPKTWEIANVAVDEQLALYQKLGFRIVGVDRDFFPRYYSEEIIENGIHCVDMIRLSKDLIGNPKQEN